MAEKTDKGDVLDAAAVDASSGKRKHEGETAEEKEERKKKKAEKKAKRVSKGEV